MSSWTVMFVGGLQVVLSGQHPQHNRPVALHLLTYFVDILPLIAITHNPSCWRWKVAHSCCIGRLYWLIQQVVLSYELWLDSWFRLVWFVVSQNRRVPLRCVWFDFLLYCEVSNFSLTPKYQTISLQLSLNFLFLPSMLWRCWLGGRKGIQPVKNRVVGCRMVICLERGADLHMPSWCHCHSLSLASVKSSLVLPFWYRLTWVVPEKGLLNGCVFRLSRCKQNKYVMNDVA